MGHYNLFRICSVPYKGFDRELVLDSIGYSSFAIIYDPKLCSTFLYNDGDPDRLIRSLSGSVPGVSIERDSLPLLDSVCDIETLTFYRNGETIGDGFLRDIFNLGFDGSLLAISFTKATESQIKGCKRQVETELNSLGRKETINIARGGLRDVGRSIHRELYTGSEDYIMLREILESLDLAVVSNSMAYFINLHIIRHTDAISQYIASKVIGLKSDRYKGRPSDQFFRNAHSSGIVFGFRYAAKLINFYGDIKFAYGIQTNKPASKGRICLGSYMAEAVREDTTKLMIDPSTLNLGFIITGLPGSGKSSAAMSIIDSVIEDRKLASGLVIISPTDEWNAFAVGHGMRLIKPFADRLPFNFFRIPDRVDIKRFYEDLAMLLSSASNAGPYQNPMEKCMLNAFRNAYRDGREPEPPIVYEAIEESIAEMHARRTNAGIKYTKHGENIKSALENLRSILSNHEYAVKHGLSIEQLIKSGVVFDLSSVSNATKPYMYALILNQVYAMSGLLDVFGDDELRMLICVEEAQSIFGIKDSAATKDLKQRIQDFRKKGIGILLLSHSVSNIDSDIRRLCQLKLYLKQSSDTAAVSAKDLIFTNVDEEDVITKLKHLDSRIGALNYVIKEGKEKRTCDTVFIRTPDYTGNRTYAVTHSENGIELPQVSDCDVELVVSENANQKIVLGMDCLAIIHLGERILPERGNHGSYVFRGLIIGNHYKMVVLDKRGRVIYHRIITADRNLRIEIE